MKDFFWKSEMLSKLRAKGNKTLRLLFPSVVVYEKPCWVLFSWTISLWFSSFFPLIYWCHSLCAGDGGMDKGNQQTMESLVALRNSKKKREVAWNKHVFLFVLPREFLHCGWKRNLKAFVKYSRVALIFESLKYKRRNKFLD